MNLSQTAELLTAIAAYDRRKIGEADVIAWAKLMTDVKLDDALEAVTRYYAEHTEWMMPAHVLRRVREIVRAREDAARHTGWAPGQAGVPKDHAMPQISGGAPHWFAEAVQKATSESAKEILAAVRRNLPEGSREALMPRTVAWEKEQGAFLRSQGGEPNPYYRPGIPANSCPYCSVSLEDQCPTHSAVAATAALANARTECRANGPHDAGMHIETCPDADATGKGEGDDYWCTCRGDAGRHVRYSFGCTAA